MTAILVAKESPFFDRDRAQALFEENRENLDDRDGFDALVSAGRFYNVYDNGYVGSVLPMRVRTEKSGSADMRCGTGIVPALMR